MTEETTTDLAKLLGIRVLSRTSAMHFDPADRPRHDLKADRKKPRPFLEAGLTRVFRA
jgi:hypothetical protein